MKTRYILCLLSAALIAYPAGAQEVTFKDSTCPLEILASPTETKGQEQEIRTMDVIGILSDENGTFALLRTGEGSLGYVPLSALQEKVPALDTNALPSAQDWTMIGTGATGKTVQELQSMLITLGILSGSADGEYGSGTAGAVSAFQQSVGLEPTGTVDAVTWLLLWDAVYGSQEALETVYPDVIRPEDKFRLIYDAVKDKETLNLLTDPSWTFSYDVFKKQGEITQGRIIGTWTDETNRPIDRLSMTAEQLVFVYEDETEAVQLVPAMRIHSIGAYRPYIQTAYLMSENQVAEAEAMLSEGSLNGIEVEETTVWPCRRRAFPSWKGMAARSI